MDIDRWILDHEPSWTRLEQLTESARRGASRLDPTDLDELVLLYQQASAHLSFARTTFRDPPLVTRLTRIVATTHAVLYGQRANPVQALGQFFTLTFPGAVWHVRRQILVSVICFAAPFAVTAWWIATSDDARDVALPADVRDAYLDEDFEDYYSSGPAAEFSTSVLVNNIRVAITVFALGALLCIGSIYVLIFNGVNVGIAAGAFYDVGREGFFWGLILPHGFLELTAICIAGGAGIAIGWAIIAPGDRTRGASVADAGMRSVAVILGLVVVFVTAGIIEGFVTPSALPTWLRVGIGLVGWLALVVWLVGQGRKAAALGVTGLAGETARAAEILAALRAGDITADEAAAATSGQSRPVAFTRR